MQVAESILFAGKAVRILRNPSPTIQFPNAPSHQQISKGSKGAQGYTVQTSSSKDSIGDELLPQTDANKIESMLQALKVITFNRNLRSHIVQRFSSSSSENFVSVFNSLHKVPNSLYC